MTERMSVAERIVKTRYLRDVCGWPEPRTVDDLRADPRVQLRNTPGKDPSPDSMELAAALILMVAEDIREASVNAS